ncbi:MAG: phospholipase D-like domain-containing protein [Candidatus Micrarchaeales archaeon]|jgi:phosphatidylserine/phosphatidylglycerophosphate/cardiolipin synthase-like enzyme
MNLFRLFQRENFSYYGQDSHKHIDKLLRNEKNILIISPYIDDYYANHIVRNSRGKSVHIISSSIKQSAAKRLTENRVRGMAMFTFLIITINLVLFSLGIFALYFAIASLAVVSFLIIFSRFPKRRIYLKIPKEFVHAKMYVGDRTAIEGSANLTYSGMHKNIERINVTHDIRKISESKREFWRLWNSL